MNKDALNLFMAKDNFSQENRDYTKAILDALKDSDEIVAYELIADLSNVFSNSFHFKSKHIIAFNGENNRHKYYRTIHLKKKRRNNKDDRFREINIPIKLLKYLQYFLMKALSIHFYPYKKAYGFVENKSIIENASLHVNKNIIYKLDLEDFFPSINWGRIYGVLQTYPFYFSNAAARILTNLFTYNGKLPQGAPSSPYISNMISRKLDITLHKYSQFNKLTYSRYADDLTFSTNKQYLSKEETDEIKKIIIDNGFKINDKKERLMPYYKKQIVTGLIVNEKLNVPRSYIRNIRAALHNISKYGFEKQIDRKAIYLNDYSNYLEYESKKINKKELNKVKILDKAKNYFISPVPLIENMMIFESYSRKLKVCDYEKLKQEEKENVIRTYYVSIGKEKIKKAIISKDRMSNNPNYRLSTKYLSSLRGKIDFIGSVKGKDDKIYLKLVHQLNRIIENDLSSKSQSKRIRKKTNEMKRENINEAKDYEDAIQHDQKLQHLPTKTAQIFQRFRNFQYELRDLVHIPDKPDKREKAYDVYCKGLRKFNEVKGLLKYDVINFIKENLFNVYKKFLDGNEDILLGSLFEDEEFKQKINEFSKSIRFGNSDNRKAVSFENSIGENIGKMRKIAQNVELINLEVFDSVQIYTEHIVRGINGILNNIIEALEKTDKECSVQIKVDEIDNDYKVYKIYIEQSNALFEVSIETLLKDINRHSGEMGKINYYFKTLCDWSFKAPFNDGNFYLIKVLDKDQPYQDICYNKIDTENKKLVHIITIYE